MFRRDLLHPLHKRGQRKGVSSVLDTEHAQQEAVDEEKNTAPSNDGDLLGLLVGNSRDLDGQGDGAERQDTICEKSVKFNSLTWQVTYTRQQRSESPDRAGFGIHRQSR